VIGGQISANMTTGNVVSQFTDVDLKGRGGFGVAFTRTHNSKASDDSPLGYGWTYSGGESIIEKKDNSDKAIYTDADGTAHTFTYNPSTGLYTSPPGTYLTLLRAVDET
ncbi:DUF6531 domain-containing protein, partial [Acinetobacter baumannii]|uniref:DUF6531 domain-containing protein n=1 Tax=Acinetobacter baumannii TaxID=470 RepID=UPI000A65D99D